MHTKPALGTGSSAAAAGHRFWDATGRVRTPDGGGPCAACGRLGPGSVRAGAAPSLPARAPLRWPSPCEGHAESDQCRCDHERFRGPKAPVGGAGEERCVARLSIPHSCAGRQPGRGMGIKLFTRPDCDRRRVPRITPARVRHRRRVCRPPGPRRTATSCESRGGGSCARWPISRWRSRSSPPSRPSPPWARSLSRTGHPITTGAGRRAEYILTMYSSVAFVNIKRVYSRSVPLARSAAERAWESVRMPSSHVSPPPPSLPQHLLSQRRSQQGSRFRHVGFDPFPRRRPHLHHTLLPGPDGAAGGLPRRVHLHQVCGRGCVIVVLLSVLQ